LFNTTPDANHAAWGGAGYRMIADLTDPAAGLWAIEVAGASGQPGSPHYDDEIRSWLAGVFHYGPLPGTPPDASVLTLRPPRWRKLDTVRTSQRRTSCGIMWAGPSGFSRSVRGSAGVWHPLRSGQWENPSFRFRIPSRRRPGSISNHFPTPPRCP